jgi:hypothetical protein
MDTQTRIGLGMTALFTLAGVGIAPPIVTSWISELIMALCAVGACWGFWPLLSDRLPPVFSRRIPLHIAARRAYEAVERAGELDLTIPSGSSPETKLNHFKMVLMVDDEAELFGVKPPSTQSRPIPDKELSGELYPVEGEVSNLYQLLTPNEIAYSNVTIRRSDLRRLIKKYLKEYVAEARQFKKRP